DCRNRPWQFLENVEWSGISHSTPSRENQRYESIRTSSSKRRSLVIQYGWPLHPLSIVRYPPVCPDPCSPPRFCFASHYTRILRNSPTQKDRQKSCRPKQATPQ